MNQDYPDYVREMRAYACYLKFREDHLRGLEECPCMYIHPGQLKYRTIPDPMPEPAPIEFLDDIAIKRKHKIPISIRILPSTPPPPKQRLPEYVPPRAKKYVRLPPDPKDPPPPTAEKPKPIERYPNRGYSRKVPVFQSDSSRP